MFYFRNSTVDILLELYEASKSGFLNLLASISLPENQEKPEMFMALQPSTWHNFFAIVLGYCTFLPRSLSL